MKNLKYLVGSTLFAWGSLFFCSEIHATGLATQLNSILRKDGSHIGISVRTLDGKEVFELNGNKAFAPASVAKMISTACVLDTLGAEYQFETQFGATGTIKDGKLNGDFVIGGSGDPSFVIEDVREIVSYLRNAFGIKEIGGKLIFDVSYFGTPALSIADDFGGDQGRSFAAQLPAVPFNHSSFALWVVPQNDQALVSYLPSHAMDLKIVNQVKVTGGKSQNVAVDYRFAQKQIVVRGTIGREAEPRIIYRAVDDAYSYFARVFASIWVEQGGIWKNPQYVAEVKKQNARTLFTHRSRPISRILLDINKLSTNFGAELVALAAAGRSLGHPTSLSKSKLFLKNCLEKNGITTAQVALENASGLSRQSTLKPSALTNFLTAQQKATYYPEYLSSLSVLGKDGTTRSRLRAFAGQGRLKTGSIRGVRSIAGYLFPKQSVPLVFALIFNDSTLSDGDMLKVQDEVMEVLLTSTLAMGSAEK